MWQMNSEVYGAIITVIITDVIIHFFSLAQLIIQLNSDKLPYYVGSLVVFPAGKGWPF